MNSDLSEDRKFWVEANRIYPFKPEDFYYKRNDDTTTGKQRGPTFYHERFGKKIPLFLIPLDFIPKIKEFDTTTAEEDEKKKQQ